MKRPAETRTGQFSLLALLEFMIGCALISAAITYQSYLAFATVFAVFAAWSVRIPAWRIRFPALTFWLGCCGFSFGLLCVQQAFADITPAGRHIAVEQLAFLGPLISTVSAVVAAAAFFLLLLNLFSRPATRERRAQRVS